MLYLIYNQFHIYIIQYKHINQIQNTGNPRLARYLYYAALKFSDFHLFIVWFFWLVKEMFKIK